MNNSQKFLKLYDEVKKIHNENFGRHLFTINELSKITDLNHHAITNILTIVAKKFPEFMYVEQSGKITIFDLSNLLKEDEYRIRNFINL